MPTTTTAPRNFHEYHSSSEEEDEEQQLLREEEEQERLLSAEYGEAKEVNAKRPLTDEQLAKELDAAAAKKQRKPVPKITEDMILSDTNGLKTILQEFPDKMKGFYYTTSTGRDRGDRNNTLRKFRKGQEARYVSSLIKHYHMFAYEFFPSGNTDDTIDRITSLSSKKRIKDFADLMRESVCRDALVKEYGAEIGTKMLEDFKKFMNADADDSFYNTTATFQDGGAPEVDRDGASAGGRQEPSSAVMEYEFDGNHDDDRPNINNNMSSADNSNNNFVASGVQQQTQPPAFTRPDENGHSLINNDDNVIRSDHPVLTASVDDEEFGLLDGNEFQSQPIQHHSSETVAEDDDGVVDHHMNDHVANCNDDYDDDSIVKPTTDPPNEIKGCSHELTRSNVDDELSSSGSSPEADTQESLELVADTQQVISTEEKEEVVGVINRNSDGNDK